MVRLTCQLFTLIEMHKANQIPTEDNLLDIQTVPILVDSSNMLIGARNLLKKSNQLEGCHYYGTDKYILFLKLKLMQSV